MFKNLHFKLLALLCAVTFWAVIVTTENTYFVLPEKIEPQVFNVDAGLAVASDLAPVAVTVRTSTETFRQLTPDDFKVSVDATGLTAGDQTLAVLVTTKKADVTIVSIEPTQISVKLEKMGNVSQKVALDVKGEPAKGYAIGAIDTLEPTVAVNGAESMVSKLADIRGTIQLASTETTNFLSHVTLQAIDHQGNPLALTINPAEIDVIVPVLQVVQSKTVGVKVNVQNMVANSFVEAVAVDPAVISITGEAMLLQNITYVETEPVNPQALGTNNTTVLLDLPEGVTLVGNESPKVRVTITLSAIDTTNTTAP